MIEYEARYELNETQIRELERVVKWSDAETVSDIVCGPTGSSSMRTHGWVLRLRSRHDKCFLEYKAKLNDEKTLWEEISVQISDTTSALKILNKIGILPGIIIERSRRRATLGNAELSLDNLRFIGKYVEIEVTDSSIEDAMKTVDLTLEKLSLTTLQKAPPYGQIIEERMEQDIYVRECINNYISTLLL